MYMSFILLEPTGRVWWAIFFLYLCESTLTVTSQNCLPICGFSLRQFCGFSRLIQAYSISTFSLILKGFNIKQENVILRGIFHVVSCFSIHFMLYRGNLESVVLHIVTKKTVIMLSIYMYSRSQSSTRDSPVSQLPG